MYHDSTHFKSYFFAKEVYFICNASMTQGPVLKAVSSADTGAGAQPLIEVYVPHVGWLKYAAQDDVAQFLREGWFEYDIQAFLFLYLREGNCFMDCGAHAGLYSVLAGNLVGPKGRVVAIEPNPASYALLEKNLAANSVGWRTTIEAALYSRRGELPFYAGAAGHAAYSSLNKVDSSAASIPVRTVTLEEICQQAGISQAAAVKVDIEGSEMDALQGLSEKDLPGRFPLLILEFTEMNLRRAGTGTENLYEAVRARGYQVCRFDPATRRLEPVALDGPVWHANYIATVSPEVVNEILQQAPTENMRKATEIVERGRTCERLHQLVDDWEGKSGPGVLLEKTLDELNEAYRRAGEANWRGDEGNKRADEAHRRADQADQRADEATRRADEANRRADDVLRHIEQTCRELSDAYQRCSEVTLQAGETSQALDEVRAERDDLSRRLTSLTEALRLQQSRVREIANSRFVRAGRALRILKSPWLDQPDAGEPSNPGDEMDRALQHLARKQLRPKVLLDIGAGRGWWSVRAASYFPDAQIYMIDPLVEHEPFLKILPARDPRFHYLRMAVGDEVNELIMNVTEHEEGSSLLSWAGEDPKRQRRIAVTTVDQLLAEGQIAPPELVKIDVQGFELKVLQGAKTVFRSTQVFILEVNLYEFMRGCPRVHEIVSFLAARGYYLFDVAGMLRRPFENDLAQMDLVFVSSRSVLGGSNRWS